MLIRLRTVSSSDSLILICLLTIIFFFGKRICSPFLKSGVDAQREEFAPTIFVVVKLQTIALFAINLS